MKRLVQFEVFEKIYFEWLVQFMVFEKIYKCLFIYSKLHKKNDLISYNIYIYIYIYNQRNSQIADQTRALDVATKFENLKICVRNNGRVLSRFSFATAAEKLLKQRKHSQKHCFLVVGSEKVVFREGNCKGNRKLRADPA